MTACFMAGVLVLVLRLVWIQFIKGAKYKTLAAEQQTRDSTISAKRGSIYDRNMNNDKSAGDKKSQKCRKGYKGACERFGS